MRIGKSIIRLMLVISIVLAVIIVAGCSSLSGGGKAPFVSGGTPLNEITVTVFQPPE